MTAPTSTDWLDLAERLERDALTVFHHHPAGPALRPLAEQLAVAAFEQAGRCALDERRNPTTPHREGSQ